MDIYEKIAKWIIKQNMDKPIKSEDILEIADFIFNTRLTTTGVKRVKEALLNNNYNNIKDSKPQKDCEFKDNLNLQKKPIDYICEELDAEGIEYEIENDTYGEGAPYDTYLTILEGDDSRADDIICSVVGSAYEWVRDRDGNRSYCKIATDEDVINEMNGDPKTIRDARLTKQQKLWYGGNLEEMIEPSYLRRNYNLKRTKHRRKKRK